MRSSLHGRSHAPSGADPIPGLSLDSIEEITSSNGSITITAPNGPVTDLVAVRDASGIYFDLLSYPYNAGSTLDIRLFYTGGTTGRMTVDAEGDVNIHANASLELGAQGPVQLYHQESGGGGQLMTVYLDDDLVEITAGAGLTVPLLRIQKVAGVWEFHMQTGATWTADL